jgi:hypothetical protein
MRRIEWLRTASITPNGSAFYSLSLTPINLPHNGTLSTASPSPSVTVSLNSITLMPSGTITLTVVDQNSGIYPQWYAINVTGTGGGFTRTAKVNLLVGGQHAYLPLVRKYNGKLEVNHETHLQALFQFDGYHAAFAQLSAACTSHRNDG